LHGHVVWGGASGRKKSLSTLTEKNVIKKKREKADWPEQLNHKITNTSEA